MPLSSFDTALTGLNNNSIAINIIGDNLANMNTTAFKTSQASFSELLAGLSGTDANGDPIVLGLGSTLNGVGINNSQGTIAYTGVTTDAAINGNGYFVVSTNGGQGYTRAGDFELNADGDLMSSDGFQVMGYMASNGTINTSGALVPIVINSGESVPATATSEMSISANLNSQSANGTTFTANVQVYDSLGTAHDVTVTFGKTGAGAWSWSATLPAVDTGGTSTSAPVQIGSGTLQFNSSGQLTNPTTDPTLNITGLASGAADMHVTLELYGSTGSGNITNLASDSAVSTTTQNGNAPSTLTDVSIGSDGVISGMSANGESVPLAQLAIAEFPNANGLEKYQGSTFSAFTSAGTPSIGVAGTGGRGSIVGSSLEQSNVDMTTEFVNLIQAQRAYEANSRVITSTDELYQDSLNLIR